MKSDMPKEFNLSTDKTIWIRPGEDCYLYIDFDRMIIGDGGEVKAVLEEYAWPYMPNTYDKLGKMEFYDFSETAYSISGQAKWRVSILFDVATVSTWENKTLDFSLIITHNGRTWVASQRKIVVAKGD